MVIPFADRKITLSDELIKAYYLCNGPLNIEPSQLVAETYGIAIGDAVLYARQLSDAELSNDITCKLQSELFSYVS